MLSNEEISELTDLIFNKDVSILNKYKEEIERLNNDIKELLKENSNKEKVIITQDNIIKEVREYINKIPTQKVIRVFKKELLKILDRVDKENNNESNIF